VPGLAVDGAGGLAACLQYLVDLLLGDGGVGVFSDAAAGQEGVDGLHGGCRGAGRVICVAFFSSLYAFLNCLKAVRRLLGGAVLLR